MSITNIRHFYSFKMYFILSTINGNWYYNKYLLVLLVDK